MASLWASVAKSELLAMEEEVEKLMNILVLKTTKFLGVKMG